MPRRGENIRKRTDGRWEARFIRGYESNGKAKYGYLYAKTYAEVKRKKAEAQVLMPLRLCSQKERPVHFNNVMEAWLQSRKDTVKQSSFSQYSVVVQRHLMPSLGMQTLDSFSSATVEQYIQAKRRNGRLDGKGGLSPKTIADQIVILKQVLSFAVEHNWMQPKILNFRAPASKKFRPELLSKSDWTRLDQFLRASKDLKMLGVLIAMHTGLRIGEISALRFSDIDLQSGILSVNQTVLRIKNTDTNSTSKTGIIINTPKTEYSHRKIPLPTFLLTILKQALLSASSRDAYIITGTEHCMEPRVFYRQYQSIQKKCDVDRYTFHALRHTFATRCIENGCDPKTLSELLGHASVRITLERYVHPSMDAKRVIMERLANMDSWSENMVIYG